MMAYIVLNYDVKLEAGKEGKRPENRYDAQTLKIRIPISVLCTIDIWARSVYRRSNILLENADPAHAHCQELPILVVASTSAS